MPVKPEILQQQIDRAQSYINDNLHGIARQKAYVAYLHLMKSPCWMCSQEFNYYEGATESYNPDTYRGADERFYCPYCGIENVHVVPIIAAPNPWFWGNPRQYRKREPEKIDPPYVK